MKKGQLFILVLFATIVLTTLILAQNTTEVFTSNTNSSEDLKSFSNDLLSKQIIIPESMQSVSKMIFGTSAIQTLQDFIILTVLLIILILIIQSVLTFIPFLGEDWKSWVAAIIITLLISMTGAMSQINNIFFDFEWLTKLLQDWGLASLILTILILIIFAMGARTIIHKMKQDAREEKAEMTGMEGGMSTALNKYKLKNN
jgi:hypothetical protein